MACRLSRDPWLHIHRGAEGQFRPTFFPPVACFGGPAMYEPQSRDINGNYNDVKII